jgi:iron complex transport system substrate-binding protein
MIAFKEDHAYYCVMNRIVVLACFIMIACTGKVREIPAEAPSETSTLKYATGFRVSVKGNAKLVEVLYPYQGATSAYKYLLVPRGETVPDHDDDTRVVYTPLNSIVCTSTTHIPLLDYLGETDRLAGFPTTDYISSEKMRRRIDAEKVVELGIDKGMNLERIAVLKPDMVMGYLMSGDYAQFKKIEEFGIPVVINSEYLEKHPLGRAEWIKFMALFFGKEQRADSVFNEIENNYLEVKALTESENSKPAVMSGILYGDSWFLPGGQNYAARLLEDAGCNYLWKDDPSHGYLQLSFEKVYEKAHNADLWIGTAGLNSLKELEKTDHRYTRFKPFVKKQVYNSDARKGAKGGSEFLELGYLRPDLVLKDLVRIAHPELLPGYQLYFHRKLD